MKDSNRRKPVSRLVHLLPLGLMLAITSCADSTGPPHEALPPDIQDGLGTISSLGVEAAALQPVRHNMRLITPEGEPLVQRASPSASGMPPLETYEIAFWAVSGETATANIDYLTESNEAAPFLAITVPANGLDRRPDGTSIAAGDSVLITISIDATQMLVRFSPSGLVFNPSAPAQLELVYSGAQGDLDGDGDVDADDSVIEQTELGLWFQQDVGDLWYSITSLHEPANEWFKTNLYHFSGYVVSWEK
jgi:hypothetical protein